MNHKLIFRNDFIWKSFLIISLIHASCGVKENPIDRKAVVERNNVKLTLIDNLNSLTVGNGNFAYTVDITGLQTFPEFYAPGIPLGTYSNWVWHAYPNTEDYRLEDVYKSYEVNGRAINYIHDYRSTGPDDKAKASDFLRKNPQRMHMGFIGLKIVKRNGEVMKINDVQNPKQQLDLWTGTIHSQFEVEGVPVSIITVCHPETDLVAVKIQSPLIETKRLNVEITFPESDNEWRTENRQGNPDHHETIWRSHNEYHGSFERIQDSTRYFMRLDYGQGTMQQVSQHQYLLQPALNISEYNFTFEFSQQIKNQSTADFNQTQEKNISKWGDFWHSGGFIDFSQCTDPRAAELERRVILSQYLTAIQTSGTLPPQETGLTYNSWYGKFHMEMHWWHGVHYALWQRPAILENQMSFYFKIMDHARETARSQGFQGVRWPKMTGPQGIESPSGVGTYLIWQQPHVIYFSELLYQAMGNKSSVLRKYEPLIEATANFMADYAFYDSLTNRYVLGPALIPAQERFKPATTINPAFELAYWYWGLATAITWKERMNKPIPPKWENVLAGLSDIPVADSLYLFTEDASDSYTNKTYLTDHPMVLGCVGLLPLTEKIDKKIMLNTFNQVVENWFWEETWGWDFPMTAMSAAALGKYNQATDFLLMDVPTNTYLTNGHNYQDERLTLYLPGNGGLLMAVAQMCTKDQFPKDGKWNVKWEDLMPLY